MAWTEHRVEMLTHLWADGLSASQIAGRLGGVTRNSVIGKIHRLGLSDRAIKRPRKSSIQIRKQRGKAARGTAFNPTWGKPPPLRAVPIPAPRETDIARVSFLELDEIAVAIPLADGATRIVTKHCKFPVLEDVAPRHVKQFCGDERIIGSSYCHTHHERAFAKLVRHPPTTPTREWVREKNGGYVDTKRSRTPMKVF